MEKHKSMKKILATFALATLWLAPAQAQQTTTMADVFRIMPDSILPTLTQTNRLDMLDFNEAKMRAAVTDRLDTEATLDTLTSRYLAIQLGKGVAVQMRLLPSPSALPDSAEWIVAVVRRYGTPPMEASVRLYTAKWHSVEMPPVVTEAVKRQLTVRPDTMTEATFAELSAPASDMMVDMQLSASDDSLLLTPHFALLTTDEKAKYPAILATKKLDWTGKTFK